MRFDWQMRQLPGDEVELVVDAAKFRQVNARLGVPCAETSLYLSLEFRNFVSE